jgi:hypothetical protein
VERDERVVRQSRVYRDLSHEVNSHSVPLARAEREEGRYGLMVKRKNKYCRRKRRRMRKECLPVSV